MCDVQGSDGRVARTPSHVHDKRAVDDVRADESLAARDLRKAECETAVGRADLDGGGRVAEDGVVVDVPNAEVAGVGVEVRAETLDDRDDIFLVGSEEDLRDLEDRRSRRGKDRRGPNRRGL